uniref:Putative secreted small peptide n=1 Tax=Ixodes ricinus TaxID=34613 RepID=A0A090X7W8_IXORI
MNMPRIFVSGLLVLWIIETCSSTLLLLSTTTTLLLLPILSSATQSARGSSRLKQMFKSLDCAFFFPVTTFANVGLCFSCPFQF